MTDLQYHELFARDEDTNADTLAVASIETIGIRRNVRGIWESLPQRFLASEITDEVALFGAVGPGSYELRGISAKGKIVRKIRLVLAGEEPDHAEEHVKETGLAVAPAAADPLSALGSTPIERMMMMQSQQNSQMFMQMMQMQQAGQQSMTQLLGVVLGNKNDGGLTTTLVEKLLENRSNSDPQNVFLAGVKTVSDLQDGKREADKEHADASNGIQDTLAIVNQAFELYRTFSGKGVGESEAQAQTIATMTGTAIE